MKRNLKRRIVNVIIIGLILSFIIFIVLGLCGVFEFLDTFLSVNYWWGILIAIIVEFILTDILFTFYVKPSIKWFIHKIRFKIVDVTIEASTRYVLPKKCHESEMEKIVQKIELIKNAKRKELKFPIKSWYQILYVENVHEIEFACSPDEEDNFKELLIKETTTIKFDQLDKMLLDIMGIINKIGEELFNYFNKRIDKGDIVFKVKPLNHVLVDNFWFKQITKEQAITIIAKDGEQIFLYKDYAVLTVKEITSKTGKFLNNLIASSYVKNG